MINITEFIGKFIIETDEEKLNITTVIPSLLICKKNKEYSMVFEVENIYNYLIDLKLDRRDKLKIEEVVCQLPGA